MFYTNRNIDKYKYVINISGKGLWNITEHPLFYIKNVNCLQSMLLKKHQYAMQLYQEFYINKC